VANFDKDTFDQYEARLAALEALCPTPEEQEINRFLIKVVRSIRMTLWLTNGAVKYFAGPLGIVFGMWIWGESAVEWLISKVTGLPK